MKIFIDAGHNNSGADTGAAANGLKEQDITFEVADRLKKLFENAGHTVYMSRNTKNENIGKTVSESINMRCYMANKVSADLFVSIHCNAGGGYGAETLVYKKSGKAFEYAEKVQDSIVRNLGLFDRGVKERKNLGVLKYTEMPAILAEIAFIDNKSDAEKLKHNLQDFANAIFEGVTGEKMNKYELNEVNDIVWELAQRGIISDKELWLYKLKEDKNAYYLAQKALKYIMGRE